MLIDEKMKNVKHMNIDELYIETMKRVELDGLHLEFGVYHGHSISKLSKLTNSIFYGFDSFKGLPENWRTSYDTGKFSCDVPHDLEKTGKIKLVVGMFQDTLEKFLIENKQGVSFIHIDCDLYSSTKYVLDSLKKRIQSGTVILFDEMFMYEGYQEHEYKAFNEFIEETGFDFDLIGYDGGERVSLIIK
jgi:hypothetical protein